MSETALTKQETRTPSTTLERAKQTPVYTPVVDIRENEREVLLQADMPGVDETSVQIDLEGRELTIRGTYRPTAPEGYTAVYQEYARGDYERVFTLGDVIDRDGIQAVMKHGVLHLTLPKAEEAQPKRIAVSAG
ncbi:MAG: Hsp20/alpha crystallin family protein [Verrucomicrobiota bacterium]|jgi:HSP20 family protein|nr:Hsp20/alpha crystallin family protein [Verrucomicrobiota bacterium]MDD8046501.1 Hsp20/alpha crystallin family protein [Verrucomicrobiota bacterium]MDI9385795.1 Hsp20/alpha crystallin family protein [Verrucomicrobiota bacterium]